MGDVVALLQVVDVVGGDQAQPQLTRDRRQPAVDDLLVLNAVPLQLEEKIVLPENVAERGRGLSAFAAWSAVSACGISPLRQLLRPMMPSACRASSSLSMRGFR